MGDDAGTAEGATCSVGRGEQGKARPATSALRGGLHLELGHLRCKSDFSIAHTWRTLSYIYIYLHKLRSLETQVHQQTPTDQASGKKQPKTLPFGNDLAAGAHRTRVPQKCKVSKKRRGFWTGYKIRTSRSNHSLRLSTIPGIHCYFLRCWMLHISFLRHSPTCRHVPEGNLVIRIVVVHVGTL